MDNIKIGDHIKILNMEGEPQYSGREGTVTHIDDLGQIYGIWSVVQSLGNGYIYNPI